MPIKSYIAFPNEGQKEALIKALSALSECEVHPSTNEDLIVLVTETKGKQEEDALLELLDDIPQLKHLSLVSGYSDSTINSHQA